MVFFYYILYAYKISRKSKIKKYVINDMFKFQVFVVKKLCTKKKKKIIDWIVNNIIFK